MITPAEPRTPEEEHIYKILTSRVKTEADLKDLAQLIDNEIADFADANDSWRNGPVTVSRPDGTVEHYKSYKEIAKDD